MADGAPLSITIGGTTYKVHASAPADEVEQLAAAVEARLRDLNPAGRPVTPQMFLLAALSFAHDASAERRRREAVEAEARDLLRRVVARIDLALEDHDAAERPEPPLADEAEAPPGAASRPEP